MSGTRGVWWTGWAAFAGAWLIRLVGLTWRVERVGTEPLEAAIARGERCVFAFWHARMLPLVYTHRDRGIAVLVSRSRDGELITRVIERLGYETARGSSSRAGGTGALEMLEWAGAGHLLAITPDGPRGPAETLKPGLVLLASRSGLPVVPVASASRPRLRLRSWDRFEIPLPFAHVWVAYGEPLQVPPGLADAEAESWRARIEHALQALTRDLDARAGEVA